MTSLITGRSLVAGLIAAPAIVRFASIMPVRALAPSSDYLVSNGVLTLRKVGQQEWEVVRDIDNFGLLNGTIVVGVEKYMPPCLGADWWVAS